MTTGYFSRMPNIWYTLSNNPNKNAVPVKNIFFRVAIINAVLNNSAIYYPYFVNDGETPESIAFRYYKDVTKHWLVMLANKIVDPQYDWPLPYTAFINYIIAKYGSLATAKTQVYDYQVTTTKQDSASGDITSSSYSIDKTTYNGMAQSSFQEINLSDGTTVAITITTSIRYCFDVEYAQNEARKNIILIDKSFLYQIDQEFTNLTQN